MRKRIEEEWLYCRLNGGSQVERRWKELERFLKPLFEKGRKRISWEKKQSQHLENGYENLSQPESISIIGRGVAYSNPISQINFLKISIDN